MTKRKSKPGCPAAPRKFKVGDRVWVRHDVTDGDYPDMPLGGWAGTIFALGKRGRYGIRWSEETLAAMHPIWKKRCAIDGMALKEYWLKEEALEPDPGEPLSIEQPTHIAPRPLSTKNPGDRVRMVFGLTSDDFLPAADRSALRRYRGYLAEHMALPAEARYSSLDLLLDRLAEGKLPLSGSPINRFKVEVVALDGKICTDDGVRCRIRTAEGERTVPLTALEFRRSEVNHRLVEDFSEWFFGELAEDGEEESLNGANESDGDFDDEFDHDEDVEGDDEPDEGKDDSLVLVDATWRGLVPLPLEIVAFATSFGAVVGAAVATMPWARWAACIGGAAWGVLMAFAQATSAQKDMPLIAPRFRKSLAGFFGLVTGAVQGVFLGIMAVAFVGAALGGMAGLVLRRVFRGKQWLILRLFPRGIQFVAACGVVVQALYLDRIAATAGLRLGAVVGLAAGLSFCLVSLPCAFLAVRKF
jgi:hypothetical protein